jgi:hypothetical protein
MKYHEETMSGVGCMVIASQTVERMLGMVLIYVIQDGVQLTYARLTNLDAQHRRKTLGFFIREMRKRAAFDDSIEATLERFLENRNKLIHHFDDIPGHDLSTDAEIAAVGGFLAQFAKDLQAILLFCGALIHAWTEQSGVARGTLEEYITDDSRDMIQQMKSLSPNIDMLIFAKAATTPPKDPTASDTIT